MTDGQQDLIGTQQWPDLTQPTYTYTLPPWTGVLDHRHCKKCGKVIPADKDFCDWCATHGDFL